MDCPSGAGHTREGGKGLICLLPALLCAAAHEAGLEFWIPCLPCLSCIQLHSELLVLALHFQTGEGDFADARVVFRMVNIFFLSALDLNYPPSTHETQFHCLQMQCNLRCKFLH